MANISTFGYVRSETLVKWAIIFIYVQVVVAVIGMISGYMEYNLLQDYANNIFQTEAAAKAAGDSNDLRQVIVFWVQAFTYIGTAVLILRWIYRANANVHELGATNMTYSPVMSVVWFFVPIMGLWKPYQAMLQIWKASVEPVNWKSAKGHPIVGTWWALWMGTVFIGFISLAMAHRAHDISSAVDANLVEIMSDFSTVLSTLAMLMYPSTLGQIYDNEFLVSADDDALTLPELLNTVSDAVWTELDDKSDGQFSARKPMISSLRRNLQREHMGLLIDLSSTSSSFTAAYKPISDLSLEKLRQIKSRADRLLKSKGRKLDEYTSAHLKDVSSRIKKVMSSHYVAGRL